VPLETVEGAIDTTNEINQQDEAMPPGDLESISNQSCHLVL
jgi:hypothetical protein